MQVTSKNINDKISERFENEPITEVKIGEAFNSQFKVTSTDAVHLLFDEIGKHIDQLEVLRIQEFRQDTVIESWCLSSFVNKAKNCHTIDFQRLLCNLENVKVLMDVAEEIISESECLETLILNATNCQQEQADSLLTALL